MDRPPHRLRSAVTTLLLATAAVLAVSATAFAGAQWKSPVSAYHAKQMALLMVRSEHSTYGGTKHFAVDSCTKLTALTYRCVVTASFPNYGGGTLVERTTLTTTWKADAASLLVMARAKLAHVVTSCPPNVQADPECVASTTMQSWAWDTTHGMWADRS